MPWGPWDVAMFCPPTSFLRLVCHRHFPESGSCQKVWPRRETQFMYCKNPQEKKINITKQQQRNTRIAYVSPFSRSEFFPAKCCSQSVFRMHCKMVFNITLRHDYAFKRCQTRWPLIGLRNLILIGHLRIIMMKTNKSIFSHPRRCK